MDELRPQSVPNSPFQFSGAVEVTGTAAVRAAQEAAQREEGHRLLAACSYLGVLFLVPLIIDKDDDFVRFHLRQGIAMFALTVVASFGFLNESAGTLLMLAIIVVSLVAAYRTTQGSKWVLPVIGHYAQKIIL